MVDTAANDTYLNSTGTLSGSDPDSGTTLSYGITGGTDGASTVSLVGTYGTLTVTKSGGAYTFVPNATAINARASNTSETYTVSVSDGGLAHTAALVVSITAVNDAPVAVSQSVTSSRSSWRD